jgi:hypothetical protein
VFRSLKIWRVTKFHRVLLLRTSKEATGIGRTYTDAYADSQPVRIRFLKFLLMLITFTFIATGAAKLFYFFIFCPPPHHPL